METEDVSGQGYSLEERAAGPIQRLWLRYAYPCFVNKDNFAQRLELEDKVGVFLSPLVHAALCGYLSLCRVSVCATSEMFGHPGQQRRTTSPDLLNHRRVGCDVPQHWHSKFG
eukprot:759837-Rhodomonas_salina.4